MRRFGQLIGVNPEHFEAYARCHAQVWPEVALMIERCNIRNYSIYHHDGVLFAYFEYVGSDFEADTATMAADPKTREWWDMVKPMQVPVQSRKPGEWWADMQEVFHQD